MWGRLGGAGADRRGRSTVAARLINKRSCLTDTIGVCAPSIVSAPFYCDSHELCQKEKSLQLTGCIFRSFITVDRIRCLSMCIMLSFYQKHIGQSAVNLICRTLFHANLRGFL